MNDKEQRLMKEIEDIDKKIKNLDERMLYIDIAFFFLVGLPLILTIIVFLIWWY